MTPHFSTPIFICGVYNNQNDNSFLQMCLLAAQSIVYMYIYNSYKMTGMRNMINCIKIDKDSSKLRMIPNISWPKRKTVSRHESSQTRKPYLTLLTY